MASISAMIALLAAQLPAAERSRFAAALRELEATAPELNARLSWSAALQRVRSLIPDNDDKMGGPEKHGRESDHRLTRIGQFIVDECPEG